MALTYKQCPNCGSKNVIKIIYGMPTYELAQEAEQGKVKLGGYELIIGCPELVCTDCSHEWNKQQIIDDAYGRIKSIKASVGGLFAPSYEVVLDFQNMQLIWTVEKDEKRESNSKSIAEHDVKELIELLKMTNILDWQDKYINPDIFDGMQWSLDIETDGQIIHKYGSNKYPKEWKAFCKLIKARTGLNFS